MDAIKMKPRLLLTNLGRGLLYGIALVSALAVAWFAIPASVHYQITERFVFYATKPDTAVSLAVIVPKTGAYQIVKLGEVRWDGTQEQMTTDAVDVLKFQGLVEAGVTKEASISYEVVITQGPVRWDGPSMDVQLQPQGEIESGNAELMRASSRLAHGSTRADAYALYAFVSDYLSWPQGSRIDATASALNAYHTRVGGCAEFANLMVALSRAAKIPSQAMTGLALPAYYPPLWSATQTWNHPGGAHAWVEVYTESGWELVDPSWGSGYPGILKGLWFGRNDGSHLSYGESGQYTATYDELMAWGQQNGSIIGAMSDPLHFVASASTDGVSVTPSVTLKKGWDARWAVAASLYVGLVVMFAILERRIKKKQAASSHMTGA
jgi:hypothetical protein